jgi:hypothetical protein
MTVAFPPSTFDVAAFESEYEVGVWYDLGQHSTVAGVSTSAGRKIGALAEWNGRIYLGYGDYGGNSPSAVSILSWDETNGGYATSLGSLNSHANLDMRVVDDELWMIGNDPNSGSAAKYGSITSAHAYTENTPSGLAVFHMFDAISFNSAPFLCGSKQVSGSCSNGLVWRYNGSSWDEEVVVGSCDTTDYRVYGLFTIGSTLYAKPVNRAGTPAATSNIDIRYSTDGTTWSTGSGMSTHVCIHPISVDGGAVYKASSTTSDAHYGGTATALKRYDGSSETTIESSGVVSHCKGPDDLLYYLKGTSIYVSDDDDGDSYTEVYDDAPSNGTALCVTADAIYVGTSDSHLHRMYP